MRHQNIFTEPQSEDILYLLGNIC